MEFTDRNLEDKIASIKITLKELGSSLENDEKSPKHQKAIEASLSPKKSLKKPSKSPEKSEINILLEYEREKNSVLEVRISHKDELITEMTKLQNELYANIEELQNQVNALRSDLEYSQNLISKNLKELESYTLLLHQKDSEIHKIIQERDRFYTLLIDKEEESKMLVQELNVKEPEKSLMNALERRNQELLLELDSANKIINKVSQNTLNTKEIQYKLKLAEEVLEKTSKDHHLETSALIQKISKLEEQLSKPISEDLYEKLKISQEKCRDYTKYKDICLELCDILKISQDHPDSIREQLKKLESDKIIAEEICEKLCRDLSIKNKNELLDKVDYLLNDNKVVHKLYEKLAHLLVQFSPKGKFEGLPSCHHVWKWITRVLEDYMNIKKRIANNQ